MRAALVPLSILLLMLVPAVAAAGPIHSASGDAYDEHGRLLFHQTQYSYADADGGARGLTLYLCPDGKAFARRRTDYGTHPGTPDFALEDGQSGYREGVRDDGGQRIVYVRRGLDSPEHSAPLPQIDHAVIDDGFNAYVDAHWDALLAGEYVPFAYLVPSRQRFYRFRVVKVDDAKPGEVRFRVQFDFWFGRFLPHVYAVYDTVTRSLIRYHGISNIRDAHGNNLHVRIESPLDRRRDDVPRSELDSALTAPLVGRCALD